MLLAAWLAAAAGLVVLLAGCGATPVVEDPLARGLAYEQEGRPDMAIHEYTQVMREDPESVDAYVRPTI
jgi:hypothetical protein